MVFISGIPEPGVRRESGKKKKKKHPPFTVDAIIKVTVYNVTHFKLKLSFYLASGLLLQKK